MYNQFNPIAVKDDIINWIKYYFEQSHAETVVIGISGGKDSTICAALCAAALGRERVVGVMLPHDTDPNLNDAREVASLYCDFIHEFNISDICEATYVAIGNNCCNNSSVMINTPARARMLVLYNVAHLHNGLVVNTSNASELYVGYSTKYGDGAGDFGPIRDYTVKEVLEIGKALDIPDKFIYKAPEDGLTGRTDEEVLGITYAEIDAWLLEGITPEYEKYKNMIRRYRANEHKRSAQKIPYPQRIYWPFCEIAFKNNSPDNYQF